MPARVHVVRCRKSTGKVLSARLARTVLGLVHMLVASRALDERHALLSTIVVMEWF